MCGRVEIDRFHPEMDKIIKKIQIKHPEYNKQNEEGFPSEMLPILNMESGCDIMEWGYSTSYNTRKIINARSESIEEKPMFKDDFKNRRCLIPITGFYEWSKEKQKYIIKPKQEDQLLFLGAIYSNYKKQFTIITKNATTPVDEIHHRIPVIIEQADAKQWLKDYIYAKKACHEDNKLNLKMNLIK